MLFFKVFNKLDRIIRHASLRIYGSKIGKNVQTYGRFYEGNPACLSIRNNVRIMRGTLLVGGSENAQLIIGDNCYLNRNITIDCHFSIEIGKRVAIGPNVYIGDFDHGLFSETGREVYGEMGGIVIEDDTWIGANVAILKGISIGRGATVGAGSTVTKSVAPGCVVAGNPARLIR